MKHRLIRTPGGVAFPLPWAAPIVRAAADRVDVAIAMSVTALLSGLLRFVFHTFSGVGTPMVPVGFGVVPILHGVLMQ